MEPWRQERRDMRIVFCLSPESKRPPPVTEFVDCIESESPSDELHDECFSRPPLEAAIRPLPLSVAKQPSDRAAHRKILEKCYSTAHAIAASQAAQPLWHGRCCIVGLVILGIVRAAAWYEGVFPGSVLFGIHWLTSTSDLACLLCSVPFFCQGTKGKCVYLGCIGPMVTLVFSMCLADMGALLAYLAIARPQPLGAHSKSWVAVVQASVGTWEFILFASVSLQIALCLSSWRIYRQLRLTGLYPPGKKPLGLGKIIDVSVLELVCEADDASRFANQCDNANVCTSLIPKGPPNED